MEQHISRGEWIYLFDSTLNAHGDTKKKNHLLAHLAICPECQAIYEKGKNLQMAVRRFSTISSQSASSPWNSAYQAVASPTRDNSDKSQAMGYLSIDIEILNKSAIFLEETLETTGCANKYALNMENHGQRMEDDGNALAMEMDSQNIKVFFSDNDVQMEAKLITEEAIIPLHFSGNVAEIPLPDTDYCTLDMVFHA